MGKRDSVTTAIPPEDIHMVFGRGCDCNGVVDEIEVNLENYVENGNHYACMKCGTKFFLATVVVEIDVIKRRKE